jgi:hypothetical protein
VKGYGARVDALLDRLGSDLTERDFTDLAMACLDQGGCSVGEQLAVMRLVEHRTSGGAVESLRKIVMGPAHDERQTIPVIATDERQAVRS